MVRVEPTEGVAETFGARTAGGLPCLAALGSAEVTSAVGFVPVLTQARRGVFVVGGTEPASGSPTGETWLLPFGTNQWVRRGKSCVPHTVLAATFTFATDSLVVLDETASQPKSTRIQSAHFVGPLQTIALGPRGFTHAERSLFMNRECVIHINNLKPQDVLLMLELDAHRDEPWTFARMAGTLLISQGEIANAVRRSTKAGLFNAELGRPIRAALYEFLVHGLRYVFPAERGPRTRGVPTAGSAPPLSEVLTAAEVPMVWPWSEGTVRGDGLEPLYKTAPRVALADPVMYRRLALVDALRVGSARERRLAADFLKKEMAS